MTARFGHRLDSGPGQLHDGICDTKVSISEPAGTPLIPSSNRSDVAGSGFIGVEPGGGQHMAKRLIDADTISNRAKPLTQQHAHAIQPHGHLVTLPIALAENVCGEAWTTSTSCWRTR